MEKVTASLPPPYMKLSRAGGKTEVPKGYVPVLVGEEVEAMEKVLLPRKLIKHPYMVALLDISAHEFGYDHQGMLKIHFNAGSFKLMVEKLSKKL